MIAAIFLIAAPLAILLYLSGSVSILMACAVMLAFAALVLLSGVLLAHLAHAADMPLAGAWVLGVFACALATYALVEWLGVRAGPAFATWGLAVLGWGLAWNKRLRQRRRIAAAELAGLALCAAATLAWCWQVAEAPRILAQDRVLVAWIDYFIHGGVISQFGDIRAGRQSMFLADVPAAFYHYASYLLPAALAGPLDLPGLPLATSFWLPLGFLTMCAGAYALGSEVAEAPGALAAVASLTVLPDASNYALHNGFLSFHWHLLTFPGATYAIAVLLVAVVLLHRWFVGRNGTALLAVAGLALGSLFFRVHVFMLGFPALLASAAMAVPLVQRRKLAFFALAVFGFALFVGVFYALTDSLPALELFLGALHGGFQEPTGYPGWYGHVLSTYGAAAAVPVGILLVLAACLGVLAVLCPIAMALAHRSWGLRAIDLVPASLVGTYVLIMLTAPTVKWDSTEFTVRPFVLLYAALAIWTFAYLTRWATGLMSERRASQVWRTVAGLAMAGLVVLWPLTPRLALQPKFAWGQRYFRYEVEPGVPQAAAFLRRHSVAGNLLAVQGLTLRWVATDLAVQLASLTGIPAYLGYGIAHVSEPGERRRVAVERYIALKDLDAMASADAALGRLRQLGIRWYVFDGDRGPLWDRDRRRAAFVEGRIAVYSALP